MKIYIRDLVKSCYILVQSNVSISSNGHMEFFLYEDNILLFFFVSSSRRVICVSCFVVEVIMTFEIISANNLL
jgi:hypothetical protein